MPTRQLLLPVAEQFHNSALFDIITDTILKQVSDFRSRKRGLELLMR